MPISLRKILCRLGASSIDRPDGAHGRIVAPGSTTACRGHAPMHRVSQKEYYFSARRVDSRPTSCDLYAWPWAPICVQHGGGEKMICVLAWGYLLAYAGGRCGRGRPSHHEGPGV